MKVVVDFDRGGPTARAHALDFFQRELAVGGGLFVADAQLLAGLFVQLRTAHNMQLMLVQICTWYLLCCLRCSME